MERREMAPESRFSDEVLKAFVDDFNQHKDVYTKQVAEDAKRFDSIVKKQDAMHTTLITMSEDLRFFLILQRDIKGAARVSTGVYKIGVWFVKWGVIGAAIMACWEWLGRHITAIFK